MEREVTPDILTINPPVVCQFPLIATATWSLAVDSSESFEQAPNKRTEKNKKNDSILPNKLYRTVFMIN
jgi:hypothetical protein